MVGLADAVGEMEVVGVVEVVSGIMLWATLVAEDVAGGGEESEDVDDEEGEGDGDADGRRVTCNVDV